MGPWNPNSSFQMKKELLKVELWACYNTTNEENKTIPCFRVSLCPPFAKDIRVIRKVTLSSPSLWASFDPPIPLFQWYPQSKDILLNLGMKCCNSLSVKCWNSAVNARGSRLIIVAVQLGAVKIYVTAVESLWKKERQDETQFIYHQNWWLSEFHPPIEC